VTLKLANRIAVVTGAGGGLGLVTSKELLKEGAKVVLTDINMDLLAKAEQELSFYGGSYQLVAMNVTNGEQVRAVMKRVFDDYGRIDILVNMAGGSLFTPKKLEDIKEEHWDKVIDVNLKGTFLCCQAVVEYMKQNNYGRIINTSSIGGRTASIVTGVPYAAAKGGVIALTRRLALEVGKYSITVNAIAPGTVLSGQRMIDVWNELDNTQKEQILASIPLGRLSTAEEQARAIVFLASDDASYITGVVLDVNGGRLMA